jgi:hypothetical protein
MSATGSPRHKRSTCTTALGPIVAYRSDPGSWIFTCTISTISFIRLANTDGADSDLYESVWVRSSEIIHPDDGQFTDYAVRSQSQYRDFEEVFSMTKADLQRIGI